jgi:TonB family protein
MKERLWPAGVTALLMHGFVIAAIAFGLPGQKGTSPQDFHVEVMFASEQEKGFSSPLVGEVDSERSEEASEGYVSLKIKNQEKKLPVVLNPSPVTPLCVRADFSHKGRGKEQPKSDVGKIASMSPSEGGQSPGGAHDPFPTFNPPPVYPLEARRKRIEGIVLIRLSLSEKGTVDKAIPLAPRNNPLLEDAALEAIQKWRFKPGNRTLEVPIEFKLEV